MTARIFWTDGARWETDTRSYGAWLRHLDAQRDVIVGLDPIVDRLVAHLSETPLLIDEIAGSEAERAVLTAALIRCVDELDTLTDAQLGLERAEDRVRYQRALRALCELVQTDVTW